LEPQPLAADVSTLGEAISAYADAFQVRVTPYDGSYEEVPFTPGEEPKFFVHEDTTGTSMLVDIHVARGADLICAKQNLGFKLQPGDRIEMGLLAC